MLHALVLSAATAATTSLPGPAPADAEAFARTATEWVLAGEDLPDDYLSRLAAMPPDQRLLAIVFLRRSGLMTGAPVPIATLLAPAAEVTP